MGDPNKIKYDLGGSDYPQQNLISNSGFGVCSQSTLENTGNNLIPNADCEGTDFSHFNLGQTTIVARTTEQVRSGTYSLKVTEAQTASASAQTSAAIPTIIGNMYTVSCWVRANGTSGMYFTVGTSIIGGQYYNAPTTFDTTWTKREITFIAETAITYVSIGAGPEGDFGYYDDFSFYARTPGFIAANGNAPDGWAKGINCDLHRVQGVNTKEGSFYSLKYFTQLAAHPIRWPMNTLSIDHLSKFAGRTVTFGVWIKSDQTSPNKLQVYISLATAADAEVFYSGSGDWEWLEVTAKIPINETNLSFSINDNEANKTAYISQPMLVFGSSIGEGNYSPIPNEIIQIPSYISLTEDYGMTIGLNSHYYRDVEVLSRGKIPRNVESILVRGGGVPVHTTGRMVLRNNINTGFAMLSQVIGQPINHEMMVFIKGDLDITGTNGAWSSVVFNVVSIYLK